MIIRPEIYDTYWHFAAERQNIFFNRLERIEPLTDDAVLSTYKFCNVYRAADRVSQFLITHVVYAHDFSAADTLFRIMLFRLLNRIETWQELERRIGPITLKNLKNGEVASLLGELVRHGETIYGNAFILCATKAFGFDKKWQNHLALLKKIFLTDAAPILGAQSLQELFLALKEYPLIGNFMAYQLAIDFNYSQVFDFNENDFTVAGPGAERGIKKCFIDLEGKDMRYVIDSMVENQEKEFDRLGLEFKTLWGRPLHAIDCQGLFCEVDKYCRVKYPDLKSNRVRMKSKFNPNLTPIRYFFPPKWKINITTNSL